MSQDYKSIAFKVRPHLDKSIHEWSEAAKLKFWQICELIFDHFFSLNQNEIAKAVDDYKEKIGRGDRIRELAARKKKLLEEIAEIEQQQKTL